MMVNTELHYAGAFDVGDESGQETLEAAIVLPLLFLILLGIFWFGRAFNIKSTIQRAARQGLKTASQNSCATCGNAPQGTTQIVTSVTDALDADHLKSVDVVSYAPPFSCTSTPAPTCSSSGNVQICTGVPLNCGDIQCQAPPVACGANPALGVRISFGYQYVFPLPLGNLPPMTLRAVAQSDPEN